MLAQERAAATRALLSPLKSQNLAGYYSTVKFRATRTGVAPNFVYTVSKGIRQAFGYGVNGEATTAGYAGGVLASYRETNLTNKNQTRDGETFYATGISAFLSKGSDIYLAREVFQRCFMQLALNSNTKFPLGPLDFVPCQAGLFGRGTTRLIQPDLQAQVQYLDLMGNGNGTNTNAFVFPQESPVLWRPSGNSDAFLALEIDLPSDIVFNVEERAAAAGITEYVAPTADEVFCEVTFRLLGQSISSVSQNAVLDGQHPRAARKRRPRALGDSEPPGARGEKPRVGAGVGLASVLVGDAGHRDATVLDRPPCGVGRSCKRVCPGAGIRAVGAWR